VRSRLDSVERRYHELLELTELRKQRLLDALALYKLYNDADGVEQWIAEKACSCIISVSFQYNFARFSFSEWFL